MSNQPQKDLLADGIPCAIVWCQHKYSWDDTTSLGERELEHFQNTPQHAGDLTQLQEDLADRSISCGAPG